MCLRLKDFVFCKKLTEDIYRFDNSALYKNVQNSFIHEKSPQIFIKKGVLKKVANVTRKHLYQSLEFY